MFHAYPKTSTINEYSIIHDRKSYVWNFNNCTITKNIYILTWHLVRFATLSLNDWSSYSHIPAGAWTVFFLGVIRGLLVILYDYHEDMKCMSYLCYAFTD